MLGLPRRIRRDEGSTRQHGSPHRHRRSRELARQLYTIKAFGESVGRYGTRVIAFEEPLHLQDEVPDEIAVDLAEAKP